MGESYEDLIAWRKAVELAGDVYAATRAFPREEVFGLTNQLRRAAVSIPSNIAEGKGRLTGKDYAHFLGIARGSVLELQTQLLISHNLGYLEKSAFARLRVGADEVGRLINGLLHFLRSDLTPNT
ncbi:MAG: four helix bundle protein [Terriglobales bacterium]